MPTLQRREWCKRALAALGLVGLARLGSAAVPAATRKFADDFGADWETAKAYTLEVAQAMPAEKYDFKPAAEMRGFGELMAHIAGACYLFAGAIRGERPTVQPPQPPSKEAVVKFLGEAFDYVTQTLAQVDDARADQTIQLFGGRLEMAVGKTFHFLRDHTTHHRGYALPYLRMNGIEPPRYRFAGTRPSPV